jgi:hypothetical protein
MTNLEKAIAATTGHGTVDQHGAVVIHFHVRTDPEGGEKTAQLLSQVLMDGTLVAALAKVGLDVLTAIEVKRPEVTKAMVGRSAEGLQGADGPTSKLLMGVVILVGMLLVVTGLTVRWYVSKREETMRGEVQMMLAKYVPLDKANAEEDGGREDGADEVEQSAQDGDDDEDAVRSAVATFEIEDASEV